MVTPETADATAFSAAVSEVDPFCRDFFENPFSAHQELREAGPVVRLSRYGCGQSRGTSRSTQSSTIGRPFVRAAGPA
jgi:hypothetical protein